MISITENEEKELDKGNLVTVKDNQRFTINTYNIICYGAIDFNLKSDDFDTLLSLDFINPTGTLGVSIPTNYDYETHSCTLIDRRIKYFDSTNPGLVCRYFHGKLGKPERVCIFREIINARRT